jgi:predicted nucleotidyltransferase
MDLSVPLAAALPDLPAHVLNALLATTGWATGASVHRRAGHGSENGVRAVLAGLVDQGLVLAEPAGRATLYTINQDHVLYAPLVAMAQARAVILERVAGEIETWKDGVPACHASVFGSFARGEAGVDSDIDVLVVIEPGRDLAEARWVEQTAALGRHIRAWTGNRGEVMDLDEKGLSNLVATDDPLVDSWRADAVHLTGAPILQLLRAVREKGAQTPASSGNRR